MKSTNCVIYQVDSSIKHELLSQYDFVDNLENQPGWVLFIGEDLPSGEIAGRTDNDDDTHNIIDLLGI